MTHAYLLTLAADLTSRSSIRVQQRFTLHTICGTRCYWPFTTTCLIRTRNFRKLIEKITAEYSSMFLLQLMD